MIDIDEIDEIERDWTCEIEGCTCKETPTGKLILDFCQELRRAREIIEKKDEILKSIERRNDETNNPYGGIAIDDLIEEALALTLDSSAKRVDVMAFNDCDYDSYKPVIGTPWTPPE